MIWKKNRKNSKEVIEILDDMSDVLMTLVVSNNIRVVIIVIKY